MHQSATGAEFSRDNSPKIYDWIHFEVETDDLDGAESNWPSGRCIATEWGPHCPSLNATLILATGSKAQMTSRWISSSPLRQARTDEVNY